MRTCRHVRADRGTCGNTRRGTPGRLRACSSRRHPRSLAPSGEQQGRDQPACGTILRGLAASAARSRGSCVRWGGSPFSRTLPVEAATVKPWARHATAPSDPRSALRRGVSPTKRVPRGFEFSADRLQAERGEEARESGSSHGGRDRPGRFPTLAAFGQSHPRTSVRKGRSAPSPAPLRSRPCPKMARRPRGRHPSSSATLWLSVEERRVNE
jgi:hypothetical protein